METAEYKSPQEIADEAFAEQPIVKDVDAPKQEAKVEEVKEEVKAVETEVAAVEAKADEPAKEVEATDQTQVQVEPAKKPEAANFSKGLSKANARLKAILNRLEKIEGKQPTSQTAQEVDAVAKEAEELRTQLDLIKNNPSADPFEANKVLAKVAEKLLVRETEREARERQNREYEAGWQKFYKDRPDLAGEARNKWEEFVNQASQLGYDSKARDLRANEEWTKWLDYKRKPTTPTLPQGKAKPSQVPPISKGGAGVGIDAQVESGEPSDEELMRQCVKQI
jgi:hypothetical protein